MDTQLLNCYECTGRHSPDNCPFDLLPFDIPKPTPRYIPTRAEYIEYLRKMKHKNFNSSDIKAPIAHYVTYFSNGFNTLEGVFPYSQPIMKQLGYKGEIVENNIVWTFQKDN